MVQRHITPRRMAPYVISGATGVHILVRMRRLSRQPAIDIPLHFFLLKNTDVVLALGGTSMVIWQLATRRAQHQAASDSSTRSTNGSGVDAAGKSLIPGVVHELRQIFTSLLLGLGLIKQKADQGQTQGIPDLVQRLQAIVRKGTKAVNTLEPTNSANRHEREYGA